MLELLVRVLPGSSQAICRLREQIIQFASSLTAKSAILRGPIGAGKSTVARLLGLLKRVAPLSMTEAERIIADVRYDGPSRVDLRYIPWYVELTLTGLVENLAQAQLFGSVKGAYTDATTQRAGVFEHASTGRSRRGDEHVGAKLTGGVVFLDEIADLSLALQAKLLPVLSGAAFYRIGGEGDPDHEIQFKGVTLVASWKHLDAQVLRPDLLSRVSTYAIDVPGIDERMEDFDLLFDAVQESQLTSMRRAIDEALLADPQLDRTYWRTRSQSLQPVGDDVRRRLAKVEWGRHGNLRGLTAALEQILANGRDPVRVIEELPILDTAKDRAATEMTSDLLTRLLLKPNADGEGLAGHLRALEVEQRQALRDLLLDSPSTRRQLAEKLGIPELQLLTQIHQLGRRRQRQHRRDGS